MNRTRRGWLLVGVVGCSLAASPVLAQDDPFGGGLGGEEAEAPAEAPAEEPTAPEAPAEEPAAEASAEPAAPEPAAAAEASASIGGDLGLSGDADATVDVDAPADADAEASASKPSRIGGSHIRRPHLMVDDALIFSGPLTTRIDRGGDQFRLRRQQNAYAPSDTAAALNIGAAGVYALELRSQPTLILLNGRRLVPAAFPWRSGSDVVDTNQIPLALVSHVEATRGIQSALYGDGAIDGVYNFVTHRDYEGIEIDLGAQATTQFDQNETDVTLTVGAGTKKTGMNAMVSYFNRQPLAADDRDWMADRLERHESILSNPLSYQPLLNFVQYPFADPGCATATDVGDATGTELRIPLFGEPITRDGQNALDLLPTAPSPDGTEVDFANKYRMNFDSARGDGDGILEANETNTYCGNDLSPFRDLVLKDERIQTYATFWHALSDHTEAFGELGYYRSENENRTAPSFPIARITPDENDINPIIVPDTHADIPIETFGYAIAENVAAGARVPNNFFLIGLPIGAHAGAGLHERRTDTFRGVLGLQGDLEDVAEGSIAETWDWELAGVYTTSESLSRVPDVLLDKLGEALDSCDASSIDMDVGSDTYLMEIDSTIKDRQQAGCFNPFYSSVANNVAIDPLNLSSDSVANVNGFINADSETNVEMDGFGLQDGGYICDPNDPDSPPCPDALDPDGDGIYELAGTPNTKDVVDSFMGEHITQETRTLATADLLLTGDLAEFGGGGLQFGVGGQFRRETLNIEHDAAYNQRRYAFLYGGPDVDDVSRNVGAGFAEMRLKVAEGLLEVQGAGRAEHVQDVGTAISPLLGVALRPMAGSKGSALEWLLVRAHAGLGHRAPSLLQQRGTHTEFHSVEFDASQHFLPHQIEGNVDLDFEKYTTVSGGLQWDHAGFHASADFWLTMIDDVIGGDNLQTLLRDCDNQWASDSIECPEISFLADGRNPNHVTTSFDNLAEVDTNGVDGVLRYTLDTKKRGMGDIGTFVFGAQGRFINSYKIKSPRALREYYRPGNATPTTNADGTRDYSDLTAEYEAAGFRNLENFAPPMPKLRLGIPVRYFISGHELGVTARYIGSYYDDSEATIEKYGLATTLSAGRAPGTLPIEDGEEIEAWTVFDFNYGYTFGDDGWQTRIALGVINILDEDPPEAEGALAYDVGIHDPRGRMVYGRVTGKF